MAAWSWHAVPWEPKAHPTSSGNCEAEGIGLRVRWGRGGWGAGKGGECGHGRSLVPGKTSSPSKIKKTFLGSEMSFNLIKEEGDVQTGSGRGGGGLTALNKSPDDKSRTTAPQHSDGRPIEVGAETPPKPTHTQHRRVKSA